MRQRERLEEVGLERPPDGGEVDGGGRVVLPVEDAGVVDQHVEPAELALNLRRDGGERLGLAQIEGEEADVVALVLQRLRGRLAGVGVAGAEQDGQPRVAESSAGF